MPILSFLELFARSGGGGSGGGGGADLLGVLTFLPSQWCANFVKKLLPRPQALAVTIVGGVLVSIALLVGMTAIGNGFGFYLFLSLAAGVWAGWYAAMFGFWEKMRSRLKKADTELAASGWNEAELHGIATNTFMRYQADWSRRDASRFQEYMTPFYAGHASLMVRALAEIRRVNVIENPQITKIDTSAVNDQTDDTQDTFSVFIEAKANDRLFDEISQSYLFTDARSFIEEWVFQRQNGSWALGSIRQSTENASDKEVALWDFARKNNFYYSLDMGWLFLPTRGELFTKGGFGKSDINNHVIGLWNNLLIQLYTYASYPANSNDNKLYLVGQVNVPKTYGGILIERKKGFGGRLFPPKGYQKYEFEWPDFNQRYNVYATDADRLATFELLNPGFMAFLYDNYASVNIEVVDTVIYFYLENKLVLPDMYTTHLTLLAKAFKELQL